ncbi:MAG TPA: anti-sigma factor, partial [Solirubrobacterales bacterium]|nr:anti-sigma factor [Solirubrobacterales bacterium]
MKTRNDCREWRELLGAYALGHLEGDERAGLEAHLDGCPQCRAELASLQPVALMLPHADPARFGPAPQPPAELGQRVAATIAAERERGEKRQRRRRFGGFALGGATAAVAAVLLLFVFGGGSG